MLKYPSWLENPFCLVCFRGINVVVWVASSKAYKKPKIVMSNAESFVVVDKVIVVILIGGMVVVIRRPVIMLPSASRMIGFVSVLLSSDIKSVGTIRGLVVCT